MKWYKFSFCREFWVRFISKEEDSFVVGLESYYVEVEEEIILFFNEFH